MEQVRVGFNGASALHGIDVALDDFGTGLVVSGHHAAQPAALRTVKIDRSLGRAAAQRRTPLRRSSSDPRSRGDDAPDLYARSPRAWSGSAQSEALRRCRLLGDAGLSLRGKYRRLCRLDSRALGWTALAATARSACDQAATLTVRAGIEAHCLASAGLSASPRSALASWRMKASELARVVGVAVRRLYCWRRLAVALMAGVALPLCSADIRWREGHEQRSDSFERPQWARIRRRRSAART